MRIIDEINQYGVPWSLTQQSHAGFRLIFVVMIAILRKNYLEERRFFRRTLFRIFLVISIMCLLMITISYDYYGRHPEKIKDKFGTLAKDLHREGLLARKDLTVFPKIFVGNLIACFSIAGSGLVPFLFLSFFGLFSASTPYGLMIAANQIVGKQDNVNFIITTLLPHGILELAAVIYASTIGIYLTKEVSRKLIPRYKVNALPLRSLCKNTLHSFVFVVIPLLLLAAAVETSIILW
jgi:stage II sporulation protein M